MLVQICLLGVRFAAILTDVRLQMFRLLVFGYMIQKRGLIGETFVARVTLKGLIRLVATRV